MESRTERNPLQEFARATFLPANASQQNLLHIRGATLAICYASKHAVCTCCALDLFFRVRRPRDRPDRQNHKRPRRRATGQGPRRRCGHGARGNHRARWNIPNSECPRRRARTSDQRRRLSYDLQWNNALANAPVFVSRSLPGKTSRASIFTLSNSCLLSDRS